MGEKVSTAVSTKSSISPSASPLGASIVFTKNTLSGIKIIFCAITVLKVQRRKAAKVSHG